MVGRTNDSIYQMYSCPLYKHFDLFLFPLGSHSGKLETLYLNFLKSFHAKKKKNTYAENSLCSLFNCGSQTHKHAQHRQTDRHVPMTHLGDLGVLRNFFSTYQNHHAFCITFLITFPEICSPTYY